MYTTTKDRGKTLLTTIHGSRLYGTHHADSDLDQYVVTEFGPAKHKVDGTDLTVIGFKDFQRKIHKGTHQALEAAFSRKAEVDPSIRSYLQGLRIYSPEIEATYTRTIKGICLSNDDLKHRRHAVRIAYNLIDLRKYGRFNPTMTESQIRTATYLAEIHTNEQLWVMLESWIRNNTAPDERKVI